MTMKTPEMEVVRFSESDVIVASSTLGLMNMNNGTKDDIYISSGGKNYTVKDFKDTLEALSGHVNVSFKKGEHTSSLEDLNSHEDNHTITDGIYSKIISGDETIWSWLRGFDNQ